jgi:hypothetical protein
MSQPLKAPKDPNTEVTRDDIAQMGKCFISKVITIIQVGKYGFPESHRKGPQGILLYPKAAVEAWLANNDINKIVITLEERGRTAKPEPTSSSAEYAKLTIGLRPKKFAAFGKSVRVHVPERNDIETPHSQLTRFSSNESGYRNYYTGAL